MTTPRDGPTRFFRAVRAHSGGDRNAAADIATIDANAATIGIRHNSIRVAEAARIRSRSPGLGHADSLDLLVELHDGHEKHDHREGEESQCDGDIARVSWTPPSRGPHRGLHCTTGAEARFPG